jgi:hypothetical protein
MKIADALNSIVNQLIHDNVVTSSEVFLTLEPDKIEYVGGIYLAITPQRIDFDQSLMAGAGNEGILATMDLNIHVWSNNAVDEAARDAFALTSATLGLYTKLQAIITSLNMYVGDHDGTGCFAEPMRVLNVERPKRSTTAPEWLYVDMGWEVKVLL